MDTIATRNYQKAKAEGRLCTRCGWMITVKNWKKGYKLCTNCNYALKGVNCRGGYWQDAQEKHDFTGDMT